MSKALPQFRPLPPVSSHLMIEICGKELYTTSSFHLVFCLPGLLVFRNQLGRILVHRFAYKLFRNCKRRRKFFLNYRHDTIFFTQKILKSRIDSVNTLMRFVSMVVACASIKPFSRSFVYILFIYLFFFDRCVLSFLLYFFFLFFVIPFV